MAAVSAHLVQPRGAAAIWHAAPASFASVAHLHELLGPARTAKDVGATRPLGAAAVAFYVWFNSELGRILFNCLLRI